MRQTLIEDYFLIGDLYTSALIGKNGSIDWLCLPYFDSASMFASVLDTDIGGSFSVDTTNKNITSNYLENLPVVEHIITNHEEEVTITDFMLPINSKEYGENQLLFRNIEADNNTSVIFYFDAKTDYSRDLASVTYSETDSTLQLPLGKASCVLHLPEHTKVSSIDGVYKLEIPVYKHKGVQLALEYQPKSESVYISGIDYLKQTRNFWFDWIAKGKYIDFCKAQLIRSAITLKLMQFAPTGAIVAAPSMSLPEAIGGDRNWDYRYTWIRDATFTLYAFHDLGYTEEAERFFDFIYNIVDKCKEGEFDISLMYTIHGQRLPQEEILQHLKGYEDSKPVRIGNGASEQFQIDVYGALIDAFYFANKRGLDQQSIPRSRELVLHLIDKISINWKKIDSGIWEIRTGPQHFTYSKVMCWVGADRASRLAGPLQLSDGDKKNCINLADEIKEWIEKNCYQDSRTSIKQHPNTADVDASNYLFVLLQYLDRHEQSSIDILGTTTKALSYDEVFVYRYLSNDGLSGKEGAFLLCSFWYISALAITDQTESALKLFRKLEEYMSPSGLLAEEFDPCAGRYLGNYPQAFSHLGYIMSAVYIDKYMARASAKKLP